MNDIMINISDDTVVVDITDIEDIITAKIEIDKLDESLDGQRSQLNDFINTYCSLSDVLLYNDDMIPFKLFNIKDKKYLFISDKKHNDIIFDLLEKINYNMDNLKEVSMFDSSILMNDNGVFNKDQMFIIHNNKYYTY